MPAARVSSIDALRDLKAGIQRFIEEASAAVYEVDAETMRTDQWLRFEQVSFWQSQARQRHDAVESARAQVRRRELSGIGEDNPSAVVERRAVQRAKELEEQALEKVRRIRGWYPVLEREMTLYKGAIQPLMDAVARDLPAAIAELDRMTRALEEYAAIAKGAATAGGGERAPAPKGSTEREEKSMFAALRRRTPRRAVRDGLELVKLVAGPLTGDRLGGPRDGVLTEAGTMADPPDEQARVVIEVGALESGAFYVERLADVASNDSGWHLGSASAGSSAWDGAGDGRFEATTIAELVRVRPALAEALQLPAGYLVVVMGGAEGQEIGEWEASIEAVLAPEDRQVYP